MQFYKINENNYINIKNIDRIEINPKIKLNEEKQELFLRRFLNNERVEWYFENNTIPLLKKQGVSERDIREAKNSFFRISLNGKNIRASRLIESCSFRQTLLIIDICVLEKLLKKPYAKKYKISDCSLIFSLKNNTIEEKFFKTKEDLESDLDLILHAY